MRNIYLVLIALFIFNSLNAQKAKDKNYNPVVLETNTNGTGISFEIEFHEGPEIYYPLLAIWIEDTIGNYIQTLYIAQSIAKGVFYLLLCLAAGTGFLLM